MSERANQLREEALRFLASVQGDGRGDVERAVTFLLQLQKSRALPPPPLAEFITVIK